MIKLMFMVWVYKVSTEPPLADCKSPDVTSNLLLLYLLNPFNPTPSGHTDTDVITLLQVQGLCNP